MIVQDKGHEYGQMGCRITDKNKDRVSTSQLGPSIAWPSNKPQHITLIHLMNPRTGQPVDGPKEKWKANLPAVKAVLHFLHKSGRFAWQTRAVE
jgi:hypothetical protein